MRADPHVSLSAKKDALDRAAVVASDGWKGLACPGYMQPNGQGFCKRCGTSILRDGQRLPDYTEVTLTFTDGSGHITNVCRACAAAGFSLPILDAIYCADLVSLADDEDAYNVLMRWELMAYRQVSGYRM